MTRTFYMATCLTLINIGLGVHATWRHHVAHKEFMTTQRKCEESRAYLDCLNACDLTLIEYKRWTLCARDCSEKDRGKK